MLLSVVLSNTNFDAPVKKLLERLRSLRISLHQSLVEVSELVSKLIRNTVLRIEISVVFSNILTPLTNLLLEIITTELITELSKMLCGYSGLILLIIIDRSLNFVFLESLIQHTKTNNRIVSCLLTPSIGLKEFQTKLLLILFTDINEIFHLLESGEFLIV